MTINRLQSEKLDTTRSATTPTAPANSHAIVHATKLGHKLLFPTYDGLEDPLPWLNRYDQFFWVQEMPLVGKVFLTTFCMTGVGVLDTGYCGSSVATQKS
jgi:hypothetical protein